MEATETDVHDSARHAVVGLGLTADDSRADELVVLVDAERRYVAVNEAYRLACKQYAGQTPVEGMDAYGHLVQIIDVDWNSFFAQAGEGTACLERFSRAYADGDLIHLEMRLHALTHGGRPGDFLVAIRDITACTLMEYELRHRLAIEEALAEVSRRFASDHTDLTEALAVVGEAAGADSAEIILFEGGHTKTHHTHQWTRLGQPELAHALHDLDINAYTWWMDQLRQVGFVMLPDTRNWPCEASNEQALLTSLGVCSALAVPIHGRDKNILGLLGISAQTVQRHWGREDIRVLRIFSELFARQFELKRTEQESETRRQQLMQAAKMASLGILVAGVAHEINNPNFVLHSSATSLSYCWDNLIPALDQYCDEHGDIAIGASSYRQLKEDIPRLFSVLLSSSDRIRKIVEELKDFARQSKSDSRTPVSLGRVAESAASLMEIMVRQSTRRFVLKTDEDTPSVRGSFQRLEQVVVNLIQNACQALHDMDDMVEVRVWHDVVTDEAILEVRDEGIGIAEEIRDQIIDPFFTTKRDSGGTGLGLSIASTIVHEHGGILQFHSVPGRGTVAQVRLPVMYGA